MLLCDDEPSPVSSDDVFFICEKRGSVDRDDDKDVNAEEEEDDDDEEEEEEEEEEESGSEERSECDEDGRRKSAVRHRAIGNKKTKAINATSSLEGTTIVERSREVGSQTSHTILVKIQVEDCTRCPEKSISHFSNETDSSTKSVNVRETKTKTVAVQVNFNSIESCADSHRVKISKLRCCNKLPLLQSSGKTRKIGDDEEDDEKKTTTDSTKIYMWSGKASKKKQQAALSKSNSLSERASKASTNQRFAIHESLHKSNSLVEKSSIKCKKPLIGCSPLKKLNRSSLTIEPDKITINLSKYSPCASRLAASSKILSSNSTLSPESPLQAVRSKSPRRRDPIENGQTYQMCGQTEKSTLQASLSLNIQQCQKSYPAPRSRSVGDSCVTSPTSEATTLSYSPTETEVLSLEEVGPQITVNDTSNVDDCVLVMRKQEIRDKFNDDYIACSRKANLETKC